MNSTCIEISVTNELLNYEIAVCERDCRGTRAMARGREVGQGRSCIRDFGAILDSKLRSMPSFSRLAVSSLNL
jgi:hypothetical protein